MVEEREKISKGAKAWFIPAIIFFVLGIFALGMNQVYPDPVEARWWGIGSGLTFTVGVLLLTPAARRLIDQFFIVEKIDLSNKK